MNFLHLKYLIEVEKYESISKAAQHLYINQPRLSKIIKEIEEEANIKIFERHNKGVVPTTKGREFLSQAKKIVQEVDYLKNMYQDDPHKLNLDICVPRSSYISEAFIEYLKMDNNMKKELNLNYRETNSFDTIQNVYDGENNLGIVRFPLRDQDYYFNILNLKELTYEKLFTFDYQILISKDNPLKDKDIYMKDLKKQIMSIVTDSTPLEEPKNPDNNIAKLYALFASIEKQNEMKEKFLAGNYGYGHAKTELLNAVLEYFGEARERREKLAQDMNYIHDVLFEGGKKARAIAQEKVMKAKEAVGIIGNMYKYY